MNDNTQAHYGGQSPEQVAYKLFERIARAEGKLFHGSAAPNYDREWVLRTYAECLYTIQNPGLKGSAR